MHSLFFFNGSNIFGTMEIFVLDTGTSSQWGLINSPGPEANGDDLGIL